MRISKGDNVIKSDENAHEVVIKMAFNGIGKNVNFTNMLQNDSKNSSTERENAFENLNHISFFI